MASSASSPIRVGVVGAGLSAKNFHLPFITTNPAYQLRKFLRSSVAEVPGYASVPVTDKPDAFFKQSDIDLVVITAPTHHHYDLAKTALQAGLHVVLEKPMCVTSAEADELCQLSKEVDKLLAVYHNRRWDGDFLTVQGVLNGEQLGRVVEYESHFDRFRNAIKPGWREESLPGSGVLYDLGSHLIDQALTLFGPPSRLTAHLLNQRKLPGCSVDDSFTILLHYDDSGLTAILRAGMLAKVPGPRFLVHGTQGSFMKHGFDPQEAQLRAGMLPTSDGFGVDASMVGQLHVEGAESKQVPMLPGCWSLFYENVAEAIQQGNSDKLLVRPEQASMVVRLIKLAIDSSKEQRTLSV